MKRLFIIGAGGHGAVVAEAAAAMERWEEILFLDDNKPADSVVGYPVIGEIESLFTLANNDMEVIVAIGDNRRRLSFCDELFGKDIQLATVIHPTACISPSAVISSGTVLFAGTIVNARANLGRACILNTGATVDHDCVIKNGAHISPGANLAGEVTIGECAWIGIGSAIKEGVNVGRDVIVGAGSAVVSDVADGETIGGVPARRLKTQ